MLGYLTKPIYYSFNPYALPVFAVSILIFLIGIFVLRQNKKSIIHLAFFYECLSAGLWLFSMSFVYLCINPSLALFWYKHFTFLGVVNIIPSLILFTLSWSKDIRRKKYIIIFNVIISLLFYILAIRTDKIVSSEMRRYFWGVYPVYGSWAKYFILVFILQSLYGYRKFFSLYKSENIAIRKKQIKLIFFANFIGFSAVADFIPKFFPMPLYPYGYLSMLIFIVLVAYSIIRYKAFDIETAVHKTTVWILSFFFIITPIFVIYKAFFSYLKDSFLLQSSFWITGLLSSFFYLRLVQPKIDHSFQRRKSDIETILTRFLEELVHLRGLAPLIQLIEHTTVNTLYPEFIDIFIYDGKNKNYGLMNSSQGEKKIKDLNENDPFLQWLSKNERIVYKDFMEIDPFFSSVKEDAEKFFKLTEAIMAVPLVLNEKLLGIINLGKKINFRRYGVYDFQFLLALKNHSTIAISNSLLYQSIEEQVIERTEELVKVQKQLIQAEKLVTVGTLAGGVAHEINNPLTAILTNAQMLLAGENTWDLESRESLQLIEEATKRCRTIVQKLMTYAKKPLESGEVSRIELLNVVKKVIAFLAYQLEQENIKVIIQAKEDDYLIMGNSNELEQVITNLILNGRDAIKRIKKVGSIYISISKNGNWIKMETKDEGTGIPKDIISKIFDPFFTTKEVGKGLGLGLSICQAIVEKHNGLISVKSEPNIGSIFTLQLPKVKD